MDWLLFHPEEDILYVDIIVRRLVELQPTTPEETDEFCQTLYPVLDSIQAMCIERGLKQVCTADLEGVEVQNINPISMMKIIWCVYEHTKNCILLQKC